VTRVSMPLDEFIWLVFTLLLVGGALALVLARTIRRWMK
jgi:hypothetical protein